MKKLPYFCLFSFVILGAFLGISTNTITHTAQKSSSALQSPPKFHLLIIAHTDDKNSRHNISEVAQQDVTQIEGFIRTDVKPFMNQYQFMKYELKGNLQSSLRHQKLQSTIRAMKVQPQDIIFCYFSTHGVASNEKTPDIVMDKNINLNTVYKQLSQKKPQSCIVIGDMCNAKAGSMRSISPAVLPLKRGIIDGLKRKQMCQELFQRQNYFCVWSSKKGEKANAFESIGSLYTHSFINAFEEIGTQNFFSWQAIFKKAEANLRHKLDNSLTATPQHSDWIPK